MKRVMILSFAAALLATGCTSKSTVKTPGIDLSNLDTTVACGDDFYDYACGGWMKKNPLKPEYLCKCCNLVVDILIYLCKV